MWLGVRCWLMLGRGSVPGWPGRVASRRVGRRWLVYCRVADLMDRAW